MQSRAYSDKLACLAHELVNEKLCVYASDAEAICRVITSLCEDALIQYHNHLILDSAWAEYRTEWETEKYLKTVVCDKDAAFWRIHLAFLEAIIFKVDSIQRFTDLFVDFDEARRMYHTKT